MYTRQTDTLPKSRLITILKIRRINVMTNIFSFGPSNNNNNNQNKES